MGLEYKIRSLLKLNLKLFLDYHFIRESAFTNIASGQQFYDSSDMSLFLPDGTAHESLFGILPGQVWQSAFRNHIHESGVALDGTIVNAPPIVPSGVYVNGIFRPTTDPVFGHVWDFINGRIIFNTPQSTTLQVQGAFSAKGVRIAFEHQFNQQFNEGYLESKYTTNPLTSMQLVYPSGVAQPFPAIFIEVSSRDFTAYELGNRSAIIKDQVKLHIWALDDLERDNIVDILTSQWRKNIPIIDFNKVPLPLSGILNTLSPEYIPYQLILQNRELITTIGSGVPIRYLSYIENVEAENLPSVEEYERSIVMYDMHTYLNAPTTPLGHLFGPISVLPPLESQF